MVRLITNARTGSRSRARREDGFSLLEMLIVIAIMFIAGAVVFISAKPVLRSFHVSTAYDTVLSAMRRAHDEAVTENRIYVVTFTAPGTVNVAQNTGAQLLSLSLPSDVSFDAEPGIPKNNPPNGNGNGGKAIDFDQCCGGGGNTVYFYPDGSARDAAGNLNDGVLYVAIPGDLYSSRALTVAGATGRLRGWKLAGGATAWTTI